MFVIPAPDSSGAAGARLCVIDPATGKPLPVAGGDVPTTPYWRRRLKCGDVLAGRAPRRSPRPPQSTES